ncbi:tyrosine-protein kinase SYK-like [Diadema setosum]|uniref:tyrosine-protein kinase SYK-like n=1 Tax=Diadema setosum TaxID=31175 RepID=UPI003B3B0CB0
MSHTPLISPPGHHHHQLHHPSHHHHYRQPFPAASQEQHRQHQQHQQHQQPPQSQQYQHARQLHTHLTRTMPQDPLSRRFYHGRITREEAEARLRSAGCTQGMFLLRESLGREGNYALSLCYEDDVYHYSIERQYDGTVAIKDGKNFAGPIELVENHMHNEDGLLWRLVIPCNLPRGMTARAFNDMNHEQMEGALFEIAKREGMSRDVIERVFQSSSQRPQLERALKKLMHQDKLWFHNKLTREEAEHRIMASGLQQGKFLVRERTEEGSFALSLCYNNFVYHYKIDKDCTGQLSIKEGPKFDSLIQMVDHYTLKKDGLLCCLLVPCNDMTREKNQKRRHSEEDKPDEGNDVPPQRPGDRSQRRIQSVEDGVSPQTPPRPPLGVSVSSPPAGMRATPDFGHSPTPPDRSKFNHDMHHPHLSHMVEGPHWDEPGHEEDLPAVRPREYPANDDDKIYGVPNDQEKLYDYLAKTKTTKQLDQSCLDLGEPIGKGNFGSVLKGKCLVNGQPIPVAVKTLKADLGIPNSEPEIMREAELMAGLDHPHIVRMIGICHGAEMMLVLELAELGPLHKYLKKHQEMSIRNVLELMYQVAKGMCYLESRQFVHRDLAARNVLLVDETFAKISDFGMSKALGLDSQYYVAETAGKWPLKWYAPECIYKFKFSSKSDVWSYGVTLWEAMSFGKRPYASMKGQQLMQFIENGERLPQPDRCPDDVYSLMRRCWQAEAKDRPCFREITNMMSDILKHLQAGTLRLR